jgi:hypothetical protein
VCDLHFEEPVWDFGFNFLFGWSEFVVVCFSRTIWDQLFCVWIISFHFILFHFKSNLGSTFLDVWFCVFLEQFSSTQTHTQRILILSQIDRHGNEYHHLGTMIIRLSYSLDEVHPKFNFIFVAMSQFNWPITQKNWKLWRLPNKEGSILKYRVPHPWDPDAWIALHFFWSWSWSAQSCDTLKFKHDTWQMLSSSSGMLGINRWNYVFDMGDFYQIWTII